jgi:hypothetical protein
LEAAGKVEFLSSFHQHQDKDFDDRVCMVEINKQHAKVGVVTWKVFKELEACKALFHPPVSNRSNPRVRRSRSRREMRIVPKKTEKRIRLRQVKSPRSTLKKKST